MHLRVGIVTVTPAWMVTAGVTMTVPVRVNLAMALAAPSAGAMITVTVTVTPSRRARAAHARAEPRSSQCHCHAKLALVSCDRGIHCHGDCPECRGPPGPGPAAGGRQRRRGGVPARRAT